MIDIAEVGLADRARKTRDNSELLSYLRSGGEITPSLRELIIDAVAGSIVLADRPRTKQDRLIEVLSLTSSRMRIEAQIEDWKRFLHQPDCTQDEWDALELAINDAMPEPFDALSKRSRTKAAEFIVAKQHGLTHASLEKLRYRLGLPSVRKRAIQRLDRM